MSLQQSGGSATVRSRRQRQAGALSELPPALEGVFLLVSDPVARLASSQLGDLPLREISIVLGDILDCLQENHRIAEAADRLYEAAFALQHASKKQSASERILALRTEALSECLAEFHEALRGAKPSPRGIARQISW